MKQFTSHIDFLLQNHDCVIIPDFGGFVLSREEAFIVPDGAIRPPLVVVGFNPDLKYNDGLLAESYMNVYDISYDAACKKIRENVDKLNNALSLGQAVQIGRLGRLKVDENKQLHFMPNHYLSLYYPDTFGLSLARVKRLSDIPQTQDQGKKNTPIIKQSKGRKIPIRNLVTGVAASAAAVLIFFVASTPTSQTETNNVQQSGFFADVLSSKSQENNKNNQNKVVDLPKTTNRIDRNEKKQIDSKQDKKLSEVTIEKNQERLSQSNTLEKKTNSLDKVDNKLDKAKESQNRTVLEKKSTEKILAEDNNLSSGYYIIIGSAIGKKEAGKVLEKLKSEGYTTSKVMPANNDRYRIYVSSFKNRDEAEKYLSNFRKKNPKLADAWLFTKKEKI